ncbi:MAG: hypothetical protein ABIP80_04955 [Ferruginibacter sp.]
MFRLLLFLFFVSGLQYAFPQTPVPALTSTTSKNRQIFYDRLVNQTINKNLNLTLSDSTEDRWEDAFYALELLGKRNDAIDEKIKYAVVNLPQRSTSFQRALLELLYTNYQQLFTKDVMALYKSIAHPKIFAMCGEYLLAGSKTSSEKNQLLSIALARTNDMKGPLLSQLMYNIRMSGKKTLPPSFHTFLKKDYLRGNSVVISFQRKNRNFPGLVMVKDTSGNFVKDSSGNFFSVTQLARSINNLPGYLTNGNTPEGVFRMDGFDVSKGSMIGPTPNVQMTMPFEYNARHFYRDSTLPDTIENIELYKNLLPKNFRNYYPMQQSFFAGLAGRTEIIAHGTTVNPEYYAGLTYYPLTPTMGCLCTKEIWSGQNGRRMYSDQQLFVDAIEKAGGPTGYVIVINIDDKQSAVTLKDITPILNLADQK